MTSIRETAVADGQRARWQYPQTWTAQRLILLFVIGIVLLMTGRSVEIPRMLELTADAAGDAVGLDNESQVLRGLATSVGGLFPPQLEQRTEVGRLKDLDPNNLAMFARIEQVEATSSRIDPNTLKVVRSTETVSVLVEPLGYVVHVFGKLVETLEIALWGTVLAILMSAPLAFASATNLTPNRATYAACRALVSLLRALPEFVTALFLVVAYGFGPIAGIIALALHSAGFLGKFYADDIESADVKPQEALRAIGCSKVKVFAYGVLPQVLPQYIAYTLYVLDRNVRIATVIGIVGAGGIGQELKGRFDMFDYQHVGTILLAIFLTVFMLDQLSAALRRRYL